MRKIARTFTWPIIILAFFVMLGVSTMASELYGFPRWPWVVAYAFLFRWLIRNLQEE